MKEPEGELGGWVRARKYRDRAEDYAQLAEGEAMPTVSARYLTIADHYRTLAEAEEQSARYLAHSSLAEVHNYETVSSPSPGG